VKKEDILDSSFLSSLVQLLEFPFYFIPLLLGNIKQIGGHLNSCDYKKSKFRSSLLSLYLTQKYRSPLPWPKKFKKKILVTEPRKLTKYEEEKIVEKEKEFASLNYNPIFPLSLPHEKR